MLLCAFWLPSVAAQSGRVRDRKTPPPPEPATVKPEPEPKAEPLQPPVAPIPPGGELAQQKNIGAMTLFELKNGLTLVVRENPAVPLAAVLVRVTHSGPAEPAESHLSELTARLLARASDARLRKFGGSMQVECDRKTATFVSVVPSDGMSGVLDVMAESLLHPEFSAESVSAEAKQLSLDLSARRTDAFAAGTEFVLSHDLDRESVAAAEQVAAYYEARYQPDRTLIVVTGNVIPFVALTQTQRLFGNFGTKVDTGEGATSQKTHPAKPASPSARKAMPERVQTPPPPEPAPAILQPDVPALRYAITRTGAEIGVVTLGFHLPDLQTADAPAGAVLAMALAGGRGSRLGQALLGTGQVASVDLVAPPAMLGGMLAIRIGVDPRRLDAVEATVFREIDRLRRQKLADGELQRARNLYEKRYLDQLGTVDGMARMLAAFQTSARDPAFGPKFIGRLQAVTADDVLRLAISHLSVPAAIVHEALPVSAPSRTFTPQAYAETVVTWAPGLGKPVDLAALRIADTIPAVAEGRERRRAGESEEAVLLPVPLPVRDFSTLNGPQAFVREDQSRPLLSIGFFFPGGRDIEAAAEAGITELMLRSMIRGSRQRSDRLLFELEQYGCEPRVVNEPDFFGVVFETLSRNADPVMQIAIDIIENPRLDKTDVAKEREVLLQAQDETRSDPADHAYELYWRGRFPTHPYGFAPLGEPDTVVRLTDEQVRSWHARNVKAQFPLVAVAGDTDGSSLISRHVVDEIRRENPEGPKVAGLPQLGGASEAVEPVNGQHVTQTIGFIGPAGKAAGLDALEVFVLAVAGPGSAAASGARDTGARVTAEVERRRMCSVASVTISGPAKDEVQARMAVLGAFTRFLDTPLPAADLEAGQALAASRHTRFVQSHTNRLIAYLRAAAFLQTLDSVDTYSERVRAVTAENARKIAVDVFSNPWSGRGIARGAAAKTPP